MALIISILISLGIVTSSEQITQQIIDDHQSEINEFIVDDDEFLQ